MNSSSSTKGLLDYDREISESIMNTIDEINSRYGSSTLKIAAEGVGKNWRIKRDKLSPSYTTCFKDLIAVRC